MIPGSWLELRAETAGFRTDVLGSPRSYFEAGSTNTTTSEGIRPLVGNHLGNTR
jgi:hypothetical protein